MITNKEKYMLKYIKEIQVFFVLPYLVLFDMITNGGRDSVNQPKDGYHIVDNRFTIIATILSVISQGAIVALIIFLL